MTARGRARRAGLEAQAVIAWRGAMAQREKTFPPVKTFLQIFPDPRNPTADMRGKLPAGPRVQAPDMGKRIIAALQMYQVQRDQQKEREAARAAAMEDAGNG